MIGVKAEQAVMLQGVGEALYGTFKLELAEGASLLEVMAVPKKGGVLGPGGRPVLDFSLVILNPKAQIVGGPKRRWLVHVVAPGQVFGAQGARYLGPTLTNQGPAFVFLEGGEEV